MKQAIAGLFSSKKAIVYVVTVGVIAGIIFGGFDPEQTTNFVDKLSKLAMAYLGGQGLADLGKYAGEAYSAGKETLGSRDTSGTPQDRIQAAAAVANDVADDVEKVAEAAKGTEIPEPPKVG